MLRLFELRSPYDLLGKHIHIQTQQWTEVIDRRMNNSIRKHLVLVVIVIVIMNIY